MGVVQKYLESGGAVFENGGGVVEGVFLFVSCLFGVGLELSDASLGAQPGVAGGAAEVLLGGALGGLGLVGDLLTDAHWRIPSFSVIGIGVPRGGCRRPRWRSVVDRATSDRSGEPCCGGSWPPAGSPVSRWPRRPAR